MITPIKLRKVALNDVINFRHPITRVSFEPGQNPRLAGVFMDGYDLHVWFAYEERPRFLPPLSGSKFRQMHVVTLSVDYGFMMAPDDVYDVIQVLTRPGMSETPIFIGLRGLRTPEKELIERVERLEAKLAHYEPVSPERDFKPAPFISQNEPPEY